MPIATNNFAESIDLGVRDPVEAALEDLRVAGNLILHEIYHAPWAIEIPDEEGLRALLHLAPDVRVFPFHLVQSGGFSLDVTDHGRFEVSASDVVICTSGAAHRMSAGNDRRAVPLSSLIGSSTPPPFPGIGDSAELICGVFVLAKRPFNPLLEDLPPVMIAPTSGPDADPVLEKAVAMLTSVLSSDVDSRRFVTARLLEVFCAELIRHHAKTAPARKAGWFSGLADPKIGTALRYIHDDPGRAWSVKELAQLISLSPSRFSARFKEKVGEGVQRYLISRRIAFACKLLQDPGTSVADASYAVGYESVPAFSRAFTERLGIPPGQWRKNGCGIEH